ncbi:MAG TPA: metallophosphoesterase family protein [Vicinamibacterales bacterium]|nr:metallophosphoesterase family protein [Vicinamibacterales bacterium]
MRLLILSDIHANVDAFDAVLAAAPRDTWDRAVVLGDLVGYGAEPNAVIERVLSLDPLAVIRGNHDKAACHLAEATDFNHVARAAAVWTAQTLTAEHRMYLERLPQGPMTLDETLEICHGAPFDEDHYIFDGGDASRALDAASRPLCLFGHTHLPVVYRRTALGDGGFTPQAETEFTVKLSPDTRYLINPGSVGQPRDGDPRAAFAIYNSDAMAIRLCRVEYPVEQAQRRIFDAGLPPSLAHRLAVGR